MMLTMLVISVQRNDRGVLIVRVKESAVFAGQRKKGRTVDTLLH